MTQFTRYRLFVKEAASALPAHLRPSLPLLPSGSGGVRDIAVRGDRNRPCNTNQFVHSAQLKNLYFQGCH